MLPEAEESTEEDPEGAQEELATTVATAITITTTVAIKISAETVLWPMLIIIDGLIIMKSSVDTVSRPPHPLQGDTCAEATQ